MAKATSTDGDEAPGRVLGRIWRGTAQQVVGRLWGGLCSFVALLVLAHHLSLESFGRYTYYLAVFVLLDALTDLGTGQLAVQRTAGNPGALRAVLSAGRRIRLVAAVLAGALVGVGAFLAREEGAGLIALACLYPLTHSLELSSVVFKNRIAWTVPVAIRAGVHTLRLTLVLWLVRQDVTGPAYYVLAAAGASALANLLLHWRARRWLPSIGESSITARTFLVAALPVGLAGLCQQAYFYVDNLFVRELAGEEALGRYNAGVRLMSYSLMIALFASQTALPWFTRMYARGELNAAVGRIGKPLFALAGFGAGLVVPWTEKVLGLFGSEYSEGGASLRWLLGAATMIYAGAVLMTALVGAGGTRDLLKISVLGLVVNLAGNAWLVPRMGIEGAALSTFVTEGVVTMSASLALTRRGVFLLQGEFGWLWFGGPVLFALGSVLSARLPLA